MSTSQEIRMLARRGFSTADIARRLGIRYQHAYNVLKADGSLTHCSSRDPCIPPSPQKPSLPVSELVAGGFVFSARWILSNLGEIKLDRSVSNGVGVYVFAKDGKSLYAGVAPMGIAKRLYFYGNPGGSQLTNQRLNGIIKGELLSGAIIDIYTASPPDLEWNGLPVHGSAGLELGIIKKYALPRNMRSAG